MTIVAAVKDPTSGRCLVGADRIDTIYGHLPMPMANSKLVQRDGWVVGVAGNPRMWMLLHDWQPPAEVDLPGLSASLAAALWRSGDLDAFVKDDSEKIGGNLLLAWRDRIFWLGADLAVIECSNDYWAIGCADEVALGAFFATQDQDPQRRLSCALSAAATWSSFVAPPFDVVST